MKLSLLAVLFLVLVNVHTAASVSCRKSLSKCTQHSDCCNNRRCMIWKRCSLFLPRPNNDATVIYKCFGRRAALDEGIRIFRGGNAADMKQIKEMYGPRMGDWCFDRITNLEYLFDTNEGVANNFNEDISKWNTSFVTNMRGMFSNQNQFNQDISRWDVSNVTNMRDMFSSASKFNKDISSWDVSNVTEMRGMFFNASQFNQDISSWVVSKVTDMSDMFFAASAFNQSLCSWKDHMSTSTATSYMFTDTSCINTDFPCADQDLFNDLCHPCNK
jgi:surface protein